MTTYILKQDIRHPAGCIDSGTIAKQNTPYFEYIYFPYKGKEDSEVSLGNGILFHKDYLDELKDWILITESPTKKND
jgi:hypothetical protein